MLNVSQVRQDLDNAAIRPTTSYDLYLVRYALEMAAKLPAGYAAIIRDRAELIAGKLKNERGLTV